MGACALAISEQGSEEYPRVQNKECCGSVHFDSRSAEADLKVIVSDAEECWQQSFTLGFLLVFMVDSDSFLFAEISLIWRSDAAF